MKFSYKLFIFLFSLHLLSCEDNNYRNIPVEETLIAEQREEYSGGEATVFNSSQEAFGFFASNLSQDEQSDFGIGNSFFRQNTTPPYFLDKCFNNVR